MVVWQGAVAKGNQQMGCLAMEGAELVTGDNCSAVGHKVGFIGFAASGEGSELIAGEHNVARGFTNHGWEAAAGGVVIAQRGCESCDNKLSGFVAEGRGSYMLTWGDSIVDRCGNVGFAAFDGGVANAGPGSKITNVELDFGAMGHKSRVHRRLVQPGVDQLYTVGPRGRCVTCMVPSDIQEAARLYEQQLQELEQQQREVEAKAQVGDCACAFQGLVCLYSALAACV